VNRSFDPAKKVRISVESRTSNIRRQTLVLMTDLAARAYELDHGAPPKEIADLVPAYLKTIPLDPTTGTNLVFSQSPYR
jgi:hypothetical protein